MPKSENQKLKLLYLRDYLLRSTDANHYVTMKDIIEELARHDIKAERKSIYDDLFLLGTDCYGMDIVSEGGKYRVVSRDFELQEVKLLVDMVQSSNFITRPKTRALITKLNGLVSVHDAKLLNRQVFVRKRVKTMNESVYLNVDTVSDAINADKKLKFKYYKYNVSKKKEMRHDGRDHEVSPFALIWVDQNYYLLAYNPEAGELRHFRVDRMSNIRSVNGPREGKDLFEKTDMSLYTTKVFAMFTGEETRVRLRFKNEHADTVIDRFGSDVMLIPDGPDYFTVTVDVAVSPQFYAWLFPFRQNVEILAPEHVRNEMTEYLRSVLEMYEN